MRVRIFLPPATFNVYKICDTLHDRYRPGAA
jgi:hypothetical protein